MIVAVVSEVVDELAHECLTVMCISTTKVG